MVILSDGGFMKIYICVDFEGLPGINSWAETNKELQKPDYDLFADIANSQVVAACKGAIDGGATEVWVKDSHWTGLNLDPRRMPDKVKLIRNWTGDPLNMMQCLDESFDGVVFIGMHAENECGGNTLSHTLSHIRVQYIKIDGKVVSEFDINKRTADCFGVPTIFISGDEELVSRYPDILSVANNKGVGDATIMLNSVEYLNNEVKNKVKNAVKSLKKIKKQADFGGRVEMEIKYKIHQMAYKHSFFPGASKINDTTLSFVFDSYYELLRALLYITSD